MALINIKRDLDQGHIPPLPQIATNMIATSTVGIVADLEVNLKINGAMAPSRERKNQTTRS